MHSSISNNIDSIRQLFHQYDVVSAYLFGSATSKKFNDESDVDFLIKFNPKLDYETYANNYFNLMYALQDLLNREVDLVAEETISNPYLVQSINQNKIALI